MSPKDGMSHFCLRIIVPYIFIFWPIEELVHDIIS